ncbi:DUF4407 domain-containing protein [Nocardia arizonensis]|uniref:DUF4407 domain-containing protein n=1 Tax=Nocardia arizonensis TaxID=1141647 RepID=UPI0006CFA097|nr:DUF4407 domain-containing protein [Nocardia arizonensis]
MTVTGALTWLGGGRSADIPDGQERSGYLVTGLGVALLAVVSALVTILALTAADGWPAALVTVLAGVAALVTGTTGRALATRKPGRLPDRLGLGARIAVALIAGVLLAELASTALTGGTVDRLLDDKAQRGVATAASVVAVEGELTAARTERAAAASAVTAAQSDIDRALVIARCEFNPTPECPQTRITGVPGRGPEAQTADAMLDDARAQLDLARARVTAADQRVAADERTLTAARSAAFADADRGMGARWLAMHEESARSAGALLLRLLVLTAFVLLALLPLVLRWWRGETSLDRRVAFEAVRERAELAADTVAAHKRAEVRAEAETLHAERELTSTRLALEADTAIERERQRTRVIAAIGGIELGITEPRRLEEAGTFVELPAPDRKDSTVSDPTPSANPPAPIDVPTETAVRVAAEPNGGLELPIIGQVPFTDTAARWIRPLVPSFVANAIDTATHPLRTARQAFEEVEEITFTLRRTRKVTFDTQSSSLPPAHHSGVGYGPESDAWHARQVAASVVDTQGYPVDTPARRDELDGPRAGELTGRRTSRELPPGR